MRRAAENVAEKQNIGCDWIGCGGVVVSRG